jgi:hypothetical protein
MNDIKKYLKYKYKYIKLKKLLGGSLQFNLGDSSLLALSNDPSLQPVSLNPIKRDLPKNEVVFGSNLKSEIIENKKKSGVFSELPNELFVIGDIHGDFFTLKQSLELTDCIEFDEYNETIEYDETNKLYTIKDGCEYYSVQKNNVRWNPKKKNSFIVLAGDIIDRCRPNTHINPNCINTVNDENCDYQILKLLLDLDLQAKQYESRIIIVLGNHEILNLNNDLRYVSNKGRNDNKRLENLDILLKNNIHNIFGIVRINRYVIVHGGINDIFFDKINLLFKNDLQNDDIETIEVYNNHLREFIIDKIHDTLHDNNLFFNKTLEDINPFWDRTLGGVDPLNKDQCKKIFENNILHIKPYNSIENHLKIIVAHCPQFIGIKNINLINCQDFDNRIFRIDVGMSRAFDSYKLNEELNTLLNRIDMKNILDTDYKIFYNYNSHDEENRVVSILKINNTTEVVINGILSVDYFYKTVFKNNKDLLLYLLSDLKKINIQRQSLSPHIITNLITINSLLEQLRSK